MKRRHGVETDDMGKIFNLQDRILRKGHRETLKAYQERAVSIRKVIHCSSCHQRCAMCGTQLQTTDTWRRPVLSAPGIIFCEGCREEFDDYIAISRGEKEPNVFWHNQAWLDMWAAWLRYKKTVSHFIDTPEFGFLMEELDTE
jgi:hypothetical protein